MAEVTVLVTGPAGTFRQTMTIAGNLNASPDTRRAIVGRKVVEHRVLEAFRGLYNDATGSSPAGSSSD